jgi:hypothetical protein
MKAMNFMARFWEIFSWETIEIVCSFFYLNIWFGWLNRADKTGNSEKLKGKSVWNFSAFFGEIAEIFKVGFSKNTPKNPGPKNMKKTHSKIQIN